MLHKTLGWGAAYTVEITRSRVISGGICLAGLIAADLGAYYAKTAGWALEEGAAFMTVGVLAEALRPALMQQQMSSKTGSDGVSESLGVLWKVSAAGAVVCFLQMLLFEGNNLAL